MQKWIRSDSTPFDEGGVGLHFSLAEMANQAFELR